MAGGSGERQGTHSSMKLVSSFKAPTHVSVFLARRGPAERPAVGPGALPSFLQGAPNVRIRHRRACVQLLMHTRRHSALLCASARTTAVASGWFGGHRSENQGPPPPARGHTGATAPQPCCLSANLDENHLSKQGRPVCWGLSIRVSHHEVGRGVRAGADPRRRDPRPHSLQLPNQSRPEPTIFIVYCNNVIFANRKQVLFSKSRRCRQKSA